MNTNISIIVDCYVDADELVLISSLPHDSTIIWDPKKDTKIELHHTNGYFWNNAILTWKQDSSIFNLLHPSNGRCIQKFTGHKEPICGAIVLEDIFVSWSSCTLKIWNQNKSTSIYTIQHNMNMPKVLILSNNLLVCFETQDTKCGSIIVIDYCEGKKVHTLSGHKSNIKDVSYFPSIKQLYSWDYDKSIIVWDITTGEQMLVFSGHQVSPTYVVPLEELQKMVSFSEYHSNNRLKVEVILWDLKTREHKKLDKIPLKYENLWLKLRNPRWYEGERRVVNWNSGIWLLYKYNDKYYWSAWYDEHDTKIESLIDNYIICRRQRFLIFLEIQIKDGFGTLDSLFKRGV